MQWQDNDMNEATYKETSWCFPYVAYAYVIWSSVNKEPIRAAQELSNPVRHQHYFQNGDDWARIECFPYKNIGGSDR